MRRKGFEMATSLLFRWLQRDDQHLVKRDASPETADPIDQLRRLVNEAQERDAADERRLYPWRDRPTSTRSLKNRLEQLRPAPDQKRDDAQRKYAEGYKFANRMESWRKVETIVGRMESATGFDSCARMRFRYGVATSGNVHVSHCYPLPCSKLTPSDRPIADRYATND